MFKQLGFNEIRFQCFVIIFFSFCIDGLNFVNITSGCSRFVWRCISRFFLSIFCVWLKISLISDILYPRLRRRVLKASNCFLSSVLLLVFLMYLNTSPLINPLKTLFGCELYLCRYWNVSVGLIWVLLSSYIVCLR